MAGFLENALNAWKNGDPAKRSPVFTGYEGVPISEGFPAQPRAVLPDPLPDCRDERLMPLC